MRKRLCISVPEAAAALGLSRGAGYALAASGQLPLIHFGRALRVPVDALEKFVEARLEAEQKKSIAK